MTDVTDRDRERAWQVLCALPISIPDYSPETVRKAQDHLAAALAEERAKARAPFLAMAEEFDAESTGASVRANSMAKTDENVRHHTAERRHARVAAHHASLIRHAAEETE